MELAATASRAIKGSLEVRVVWNPEELGTLSPIQYQVYWQGNLKVLHWGLYPLGKRRDLWVISPYIVSSTL